MQGTVTAYRAALTTVYQRRADIHSPATSLGTTGSTAH